MAATLIVSAYTLSRLFQFMTIYAAHHGNMDQLGSTPPAPQAGPGCSSARRTLPPMVSARSSCIYV